MPQISAPYLSLHEHEAPDTPSYIVGTRDGLMALIYTTLDALLGRDPQHRCVVDEHGVEYEVAIRLIPTRVIAQALGLRRQP
jgi:hypothetical protein